MPQAPRILGVKRHVFAVHTAPWYKSLTQGDQNKYKAEQIQVSGIPMFGGPCQRCVVRRLPCRVLNPNSKIAEFTRPSRCALCIVDESTGENISRSCTFNDDRITHAEHEASLPLFTGNVPLLWGPFGLEKPTPAPVKCADNKSSTFIPSPLENEVTIQYPLESAEVQERLEAIHHFVDYTLDMLASENIVRDDCLPFSGPNIAQINDHDRNNRKSITTVSLLVNSLRTMNLSDIPNYFQSSSLERLSMRTIFRALVSWYLLEAVFSRMPKDIEHFRASIKPHLQGYPEKINDAVENSFCLRNNSTRFVDDPIRTGYGDLCYFPDNFTFQEIGEELIDALLPLCLLSRKPRQKIVAACTSSCTEIAYLASELNLIVKARPRSPVTFYSPFGEVQITLLLGIKPAGNPSRPYAAARVELLRSEEA
ncbi:hypothetical protein BCON_0116g00050 [Botryotinia convoluta]|uniref:Uncharacterized protein n=1 Tax=Botryotinia convoluta TaxID=54673 RepID=A0A4Z1HXS1_9HELO|nr:hypothetical protein BCON_0116g00050 [Botryotinia convoluta]